MIDSERWKVVQIEMSEGLQELCCESDYHGVETVFLWRGVALGHDRFSTAQLPLTPGQLANSAARSIAPAVGAYVVAEGFQSPVATLSAPAPCEPEKTLRDLLALEAPMSSLTDVLAKLEGSAPTLTLSVAICTRNRPRELERCLQSILASCQSPLEIIVVDNAPENDSTAQLITHFPEIRYLREPCKGLSAARNCALENAIGDIVAFVDDDVVVSPNWIMKVRSAFGDKKVMAVTGLVLPAELETRAQMIFEDFSYFNQGYRKRYFDSQFFAAFKNKAVPVWTIGAGANMAVRRDAFKRGHAFDTSLGPGVFGGCGEDSAYWYGLLAAGWSCAYEPAAMVFHYHRKSMASLRLQIRDYMQGHVAALLLQFFEYRHWGNLRRLFLRMPLDTLVELLWAPVSVKERVLFDRVLGYISGLRFVFHAKQRGKSPGTLK